MASEAPETQQATCPHAPGLNGAAFKADPYPAYAWLREHAPVYCRASADGAARMWFITRYADAVDALRDHATFVKDVHSTMTAAELAALPAEPPLYRLLTRHMLNADGPTHARLRGLVNRAFTVRMIEQLTPRVEALAQHQARVLAEHLHSHSAADLIEDFAFPFAIDVIGDLLGMDERDHQRLAGWSRVLVSPSANSARNEAKTTRLRNVMQDFTTYLQQLCAERRRRPRADLITSLLATEGAGAEPGDHLSQDELFSMVLLIVVVGHETSVHMIGNAMLNLLLRPDLAEPLRADHALIPRAVEELIRYDGPVERATIRFAARDVTLHGQTIRRGDAVSIALAGAHRDPAAFPQPDAIDLTRADNRHLGFGLGVHYCLGAPLARVEGRVALETLLRLPPLALAVAPADLRWHTNPILHGVRRLPVRWA